MKKKMPLVKDSLKSLGVAPHRSRGQNFIINPQVVADIVSFGSPSSKSDLVEIGPGLGALTEKLIGLGNSLSVIEIEPQFANEIERKWPTVKVYLADARTFDFSQIGSKITVFGNLPYSFSTDILFTLLAQHHVVERAVVMLQKEFAERVAAPPGSRTYGVLSVMAQMYADVRLGPVIPGTSFHPPTQVESILLELVLRGGPRYTIPSRELLRKVVQGAFLQRRKKVRNSLMAASIAPDRDILESALGVAGIDGDDRGERLTLKQFAALTCALYGSTRE